MIWNNHWNLKNEHAFLGASKFHWINYSPEKLEDAYVKFRSVKRGTELHEYARQAIKLGIKQRGNRQTLSTYINDAIGYRMTPEQVLYYSDNCFGTADAISFRDGILRIHDLKTGTIPAHMEQLMIYAALFCLEYRVKPGTIKIELRIYQNDDVQIFQPEADDILPLMSKIEAYDKIIEKMKQMEG